MENTFERFDEYRIRRLQQGERIESFDCGDFTYSHMPLRKRE